MADGLDQRVYLKGKFDAYGLKTRVGEMVALGAYEISEDVVTVHIVYMESQAQSNPTLCERPKLNEARFRTFLSKSGLLHARKALRNQGFFLMPFL